MSKAESGTWLGWWEPSRCNTVKHISDGEQISCVRCPKARIDMRNTLNAATMLNMLNTHIEGSKVPLTPCPKASSGFRYLERRCSFCADLPCSILCEVQCPLRMLRLPTAVKHLMFNVLSLLRVISMLHTIDLSNISILVRCAHPGNPWLQFPRQALAHVRDLARFCRWNRFNMLDMLNPRNMLNMLNVFGLYELLRATSKRLGAASRASKRPPNARRRPASASRVPGSALQCSYASAGTGTSTGTSAGTSGGAWRPLRNA